MQVQVQNMEVSQWNLQCETMLKNSCFFKFLVYFYFVHRDFDLLHGQMS